MASKKVDRTHPDNLPEQPPKSRVGLSIGVQVNDHVPTHPALARPLKDGRPGTVGDLIQAVATHVMEGFRENKSMTLTLRDTDDGSFLGALDIDCALGSATFLPNEEQADALHTFRVEEAETMQFILRNQDNGAKFSDLVQINEQIQAAIPEGSESDIVVLLDVARQIWSEYVARFG